MIFTFVDISILNYETEIAIIKGQRESLGQIGAANLKKNQKHTSWTITYKPGDKNFKTKLGNEKMES